jgi:hypothetical protein
MYMPPSDERCPHLPEERAARYSKTPRPAGTNPETITLAGLSDLADAVDTWLLDWILTFDPDRRRWALWFVTGDDPPMTLHDTCAPQVRRQHTTAAQQWATDLLNSLASQHQQAARNPGTTAPGAPARVTEWRTITIGDDWHGYMPLFTSSPACRLPFHDLDPDTGSTCCQPGDDDNHHE